MIAKAYTSPLPGDTVYDASTAMPLSAMRFGSNVQRFPSGTSGRRLAFGCFAAGAVVAAALVAAFGVVLAVFMRVLLPALIALSSWVWVSAAFAAFVAVVAAAFGVAFGVVSAILRAMCVLLPALCGAFEWVRRAGWPSPGRRGRFGWRR